MTECGFAEFVYNVAVLRMEFGVPLFPGFLDSHDPESLRLAALFEGMKHDCLFWYEHYGTHPSEFEWGGR